MDYVLQTPKTPKRPTPAVLETDRAKWDEKTARYWPKFKLPPDRKEGKCVVHTCDRTRTHYDQDGEVCASCRKHLSQLNNPVSWAVQTLKNRWTTGKRTGPFDLTPEALEALLMLEGRWEAFMIAPDVFSFTPRHPALGYTAENLIIRPRKAKS